MKSRVRDPRDFVSPEVWDREIALLVRDHPFDEVMATRLFNAAVSYVITTMEKWGQGLEMCCGRLVDMAVHAFILDTKNYREFCTQHFDYGNGLAGRKLTLLRWNYAPETWADLLKRNGFADIEATTLRAPDPEDVGTLMVRARMPDDSTGSRATSRRAEQPGQP